MNVTSKGRYALRIMIYLAQHREDGFVSLEYSIGEILRCIEDNLAPVACIKEGEIQCDRSGGCLTVPMWKELDDITNAYLDTVSLNDLLTGEKWRKALD